MSKSDAIRLPEYLRHILEAIERIHRYVESFHRTLRDKTAQCP